MMLKNMLRAKPNLDKEKALLVLELAEIREISEFIFKRIEKKLQVLEAVEASVDKKIDALERLVHRAEALRSPADVINRPQEIIALKQKGLGTNEIAEILGLPQGEVGLVLELHAQRA